MNRNPSQFELDVQSLRQQSLVHLHANVLQCAPDPVETAEDSKRLFALTSFAMSMVRNRVDPIYPKDQNGGEVVAMGTEDTMACGLLLDQDEDRLFGKNSAAKLCCAMFLCRFVRPNLMHFVYALIHAIDRI